MFPSRDALPTEQNGQTTDSLSFLDTHAHASSNRFFSPLL